MNVDALNLFLPLLPEAFLTLCALCALGAGVFSRVNLRKANADTLVWVGFGGAFVLLCLTGGDAFFSEDGLFVSDGYARFVRMTLYASGALSLSFGQSWLKYKKYARFEYPVLLAFSVAGAGTALCAENFLPLFLGLEAAQLPLCFLTSYKRQGERSTEAGAQYVLISLLSSALILFGVSALYVCTGTLDFSQTVQAAKTEDVAALLPALAFIAAGFMMKGGAAPFHLWTASVYEGMPTPVTAFAAVVWRFAVWTAFAKVVFYPLAFAEAFWSPVLLFSAAAGVYAGSFGALTQTNVKRLAAYTLTVSNGFILLAIQIGEPSSFLFFVLIDAVLTAGLFAVALSLRIGGDLSEDVDTLAGQGRVKPVRAALYALIFLGMTGFPPFAGFWRRFFLFENAVQNGDFLPCVLMMAGAFVLAYAYLKILRRMYASQPKDDLSPVPLSLRAALWAAAGVSLLLSFPASSVFKAAERAVLFTGG